MSTNDTVVLLASGASGAVPSAESFSAGLTQVCAELARKLQLTRHRLAVEKARLRRSRTRRIHLVQ